MLVVVGSLFCAPRNWNLEPQYWQKVSLPAVVLPQLGQVLVGNKVARPSIKP